jgi:NAD(P)-dependent dehydrogenase (short-subunit alcohol dehydrogenase family)
MGKLEGRVAIVTGASSGIGRATAKLFAAEGAKVVIIARRSEKLDRVAEEITQQGGACLALPTDVSKGPEIKTMVKRTLERYGRIDILLNNAGVLPTPIPLVEMTEQDWDRVFAVNMKSIFWTVQCVWPTMVEQGGGTIINTASVIAFRGVAGMAAYCSSKAAVVMLTRTLAIEGAPVGIRVNCVCPGFVNTPMNDWLGSLQPDRDVWLNDMISQIPLQRAGTPEEIAYANLYLASNESSFMTGQTMILDGGVLA